jgi:cytoskeletal protein CcmA (bactofilin family)
VRRLLGLVGLLAALASGALFVGDNSWTLPADQTRVGDVYFGGTVLRLDGRLDGSLVAAGQNITVGGPLTRNLIAAGQNVDITGAVGGDAVCACAALSHSGQVDGALRVLAGTIFITGGVGQDVVAGCGTLNIGKDAEVRGDVVATCRALEIGGTVRGDVRATAAAIVISGSVDGDVEVTDGEKLVLTEDARVFGNLRYRSAKPLDLKNPDLVFGTVEHIRVAGADEISDARRLRPRPNLFVAFFLPFALLSLVGGLVVGFLLLAVWRTRIDAALDRALVHWGRTVGFGALGFLVGPMTILVAFALIITIPAGLIALAAYLVSVYLAKVFCGMLVGRLVFRLFGAPDASIWLTTPVGIVIVYALTAIPFAGWIIWLLVLAVGFGVITELVGMTRQP